VAQRSTPVAERGSDRQASEHSSMAKKTGRNALCSCGSGRKVKRCCGVSRGPSEESLAQAFMWTAVRESMSVAPTVTEEELALLVGELDDVPCIDLALQIELPKLLSPALGRLCEAVAEDDGRIWEAAIDEALDEIDTPLERARLARAVIAARDAGRLDRRLATVALIDLAGGSRGLLLASLIEAVAVHVGRARTPAGILLAA
jgi:SEC-C motif